MSAGLRVTRMEAPEIDLDVLSRVHERSYIEHVRAFCAAGGGAFDMDTFASAASWQAAIRAAGAGPAAVSGLREGLARTAFISARPPGHHALGGQAMGFCLFNNVAVTARALVDGGERVAIVDWDVHHGNGTQAMFEDDPDILYVSFHQHPLYPGGGDSSERGVGRGEGTIVNIPVPPRTGGDVLRAATERIVLPVITQFAPDWILVSAGYDAHDDDPLAELRMQAVDYARSAMQLEAAVPGRVVYFLEGGYHLPAITESVAATLQGAVAGSAVGTSLSSPQGSWLALDIATASAQRYWRLG